MKKPRAERGGRLQFGASRLSSGLICSEVIDERSGGVIFSRIVDQSDPDACMQLGFCFVGSICVQGSAECRHVRRGDRQAIERLNGAGWIYGHMAGYSDWSGVPGSHRLIFTLTMRNS